MNSIIAWDVFVFSMFERVTSLESLRIVSNFFVNFAFVLWRMNVSSCWK